MSDLVDVSAISELRASLGDIAPEAFGAFMEEVEDRLKQLCAINNVADAKIHFHSIKGTGAAYGATGLSAFAMQLETSAADGSLTNDALSLNIEKLREIWEVTKSHY